jgi:glycosyltransferase involved in cell wall biosynthesis
MNTTDTPTVAVVVPTHNRPELLRRAIDAILSQDYPGRIDVVVVFDRAEPDETLVRDEPTRSVRVTTNVRTPGLPGGRNSGIAMCPDADYLAFCDDDDMWLPGKVAAQVAELERHRDAALATTGVVIDFEGDESRRPSPVPELTYESLIRNRTTEAHPSTFMFRRSSLTEIGDVDEVIPGGYSEDYDYLLRTAKVGRILCLHEPLVSVRWGRTSYFTRRWQSIVDAQRYLMRKHPAFKDDRRAETRVRGQIAFALAAMGDRRATFREVGAIITRWPLERRWPLATLVALKVVKPERVLELAHKAGRGI